MLARLIDWCARNASSFSLGRSCSCSRASGACAHSARCASRYLGCRSHRPYRMDRRAAQHHRGPGHLSIVTPLLAAPHVKAVRAQTMFGDSYVFVVFEDGTDLYWARSRVLEYLQQITGQPARGRASELSAPMPPARAGCTNMPSWTTTTTKSRGLRSLRTGICAISSKPFPEWPRWPPRRLRAPVSGAARSRQASRIQHPALDGDRRVRASTNEVGGTPARTGRRANTWSGASAICITDDLENVPVANKNGTPVLVRDLGERGLRPRYPRRASPSGMAKARQSPAWSSCAMA